MRKPNIDLNTEPTEGAGPWSLWLIIIPVIMGGAMYVAFNPSYDPDTCAIVGVKASQTRDANDEQCNTPDAGAALRKGGELDPRKPRK